MFTYVQVEYASVMLPHRYSKTAWPKADNRQALNPNSPDMVRLVERGVPEPIRLDAVTRAHRRFRRHPSNEMGG